MNRITTWALKGFPALALFSFLAAGCAFGHRYEAISGRVIDADTKEPLEGAVVVAVYNVAMISVGGTSRQHEDAQEAKTDARGEFTLPEKSFSRVLIFGHYEEEPELYAAKPGYGEYVGPSMGLGLSYVHPRATGKRTNVSQFEIAPPRLSTSDERVKYASWLPVVPSKAAPYFVDRRKVPNFVELQNRELEEVGLLPHRSQEKKP